MVLLKTSLLLASCLILIQGSFASENTYTDGRIINGTQASVNATKHQVSIRRRLNDGYFFGTGHICGGSLIAPRVVLSAAHCFLDQIKYDGTFLPLEDFIVVMGNLDRFEKNNFTLIYDIEKIIFDLIIFDVTTYEKDIALVFLSGSVPQNHLTVQPISINRQSMKANTVCQVTGWGTTEKEYLSDVLMTVDVPIIDFEVCLKDNLFEHGSVREGMLCAGYWEEGERDSCSGDSGGPLVCEKLLTGIVSWGESCALPRLPGVYTDVAFWAPWIDKQLKANNITIPGGKDGAMSSFKGSVMLLCIVILGNGIINVL